jgi:hypothetical protein
MNLKKVLILPVAFLLTNIMYIACCDCKPTNKIFYEAINLLVKPYGSNSIVVDNGTPVNMDSLYLDGMFYTNCVVSNKNNFSFLINTANACKCSGNCGYKGLKSKLTSVEITSDNIYKGIPANTSLNIFFKTYDKYNPPTGIYLSIDSMVTLINLNQRELSSLNFYTTTKPGNTLGHQINFKATFANGSIFSSKTKAIYWQ